MICRFWHDWTTPPNADDVRMFAGEHHATAVVPEAARKILRLFDATSAPHELKVPRA